jgi:hypothetical protein
MTRMPTEECEEVEQCLYEISLRYIVHDKGITSSFGEFFAIIAEYEREMCILWECDAESTSCEYLSGHRTDPLFTSHHMRDRHEMIVDDDSSMIGRIDAIRFEEDGIISLIRIELDTTTDHIVEYKDFVFWDFESDSISLTISNTSMSLFQRNMTTMSIISRSEMELDLLFMEELESFRSTETIICSSLLTWPVSTIMMRPLIRPYTDEREGRYDLIYCIFDETTPISILDSHDELSLIVPGP